LNEDTRISMIILGLSVVFAALSFVFFSIKRI